MRLFRKSKKGKKSDGGASAVDRLGTPPAVDALPHHDGLGGGGSHQASSGRSGMIGMSPSNTSSAAGSSKYQVAMAAYRDAAPPGESSERNKYGVGAYDNPMDDVRARLHYRTPAPVGGGVGGAQGEQQRAGGAVAAGATGLEGPSTAVGIAASASASESSGEFVGGGGSSSARSILHASSTGAESLPAHDEESQTLPMAEASARRKTPDVEDGGDGGGNDGLASTSASAGVEAGPDLPTAPSYAESGVGAASESCGASAHAPQQTLSEGPSAILGRHHRTESLDDTTVGGSSDSAYGLGALGGAMGTAARIPPPYGPRNTSTSGTPYKRANSATFRPEVPDPDTVYEERYGDAYVGGTLRYVYPSGYQSMRPRSGPWKLSVAITSLFTWLSVFIVGHCSDRADAVLADYNNNNAEDGGNGGNAYNGNGYDFDDDVLVMETKWCGSRMLYFMWVVSVIITGVACAYCGIIGYIKVRDFAVANQRSQPPGMAGKSDYYVRLDEAQQARAVGGGGGGGGPSSYPPPPPPPGGAGAAEAYGTSYQDGRTSIYQSDGTPQFWGSHIYRPTQAAVMVTSR